MVSWPMWRSRTVLVGPSQWWWWINPSGGRTGAALLSPARSGSRKAQCLVIRSNTQRTAAHGFYLGRGCALVKEQKVFVKRCLPDGGAARKSF